MGGMAPYEECVERFGGPIGGLAVTAKYQPQGLLTAADAVFAAATRALKLRSWAALVRGRALCETYAARGGHIGNLVVSRSAEQINRLLMRARR